MAYLVITSVLKGILFSWDWECLRVYYIIIELPSDSHCIFDDNSAMYCREIFQSRAGDCRLPMRAPFDHSISPALIFWITFLVRRNGTLPDA